VFQSSALDLREKFLREWIANITRQQFYNHNLL
jgi:hypothetical protein